MTNLPSSFAPAVEEDRTLTDPWFSFFSDLVQGPGPIVSMTMAPSPAVYTAKVAGHLHLAGGTMSSVVLTRGKKVPVSITITGELVPMAMGDSVEVTYSVPPVASFIPE